MRKTRLVVAVLAAISMFASPAVAMPSLEGEFTVDGEWPRPSHISTGDHGPWVSELQAELNEAGFRAGDPDGEFGRATLAAVYAFEKVHGLTRDGVFETADWKLLNQEIPSLPAAPDEDRVEVDLDKQVLFLVEENEISLVLPISSANGETYRHSSGRTVRAVTPEGGYSFYKNVDGWRISYLGGLYRPFYFSGGYAIHGSGSVPPYPASHGCIRVEMWDMDYLAGELELGMPIYVYGARNERSTIVPTLPPTVDELAARKMAGHLRPR